MLDTETFITNLRDKLKTNTSLINVYSPDLPQEKQKIACITMLGGNPVNNLCGLDYANITIRILIRGNSNDKETRHLCDEVFNYIHFLKVDKAVIIAETTPIFVGKDENDNNLYNITCRVILNK